MPVWDVKSTGKLTIISPDSYGGTVGWLIESNSNDIKSIRAHNATQVGIKITGASNGVSFNSVSGSTVGILIQGNANDVHGSTVSGNTTGIQIGAAAGATSTGNFFRTATVGPNTGVGIVVNGPGNTVRDDTVTGNGGNGVVVAGANNTIYNHSSYSNGGDGFVATGAGNTFDTDKSYKNKTIGFNVASSAMSTKFRYDESNIGASGSSYEIGGCEYKFAVAISNLGGNKKDNISFTAFAIGNYE